MKYEEYLNPKYSNKAKWLIERKNYNVLNVYYSDFTVDMRNELLNEVNSLALNTNSKGANTGEARIEEKKKLDAFIGVISEMATEIMFNTAFKTCIAKREESAMYEVGNHIDIRLNTTNNSYDVEVRSSFVNKGINFALFNKDVVTGRQHFNVIGPYNNLGYKKEKEKAKDFYIRTLFSNENKIKENYQLFKESFINNKFPVTIIGGTTDKKIEEIGFQKQFNPSDSQVKEPGIYDVIDIKDIYDVKELKNYFEINSI